MHSVTAKGIFKGKNKFRFILKNEGTEVERNRKSLKGEREGYLLTHFRVLVVFFGRVDFFSSEIEILFSGEGVEKFSVEVEQFKGGGGLSSFQGGLIFFERI